MLISFLMIIFTTYANLDIQIRAEGQKSLFNKHLRVAAIPLGSFMAFYCNGTKVTENRKDRTYNYCTDKKNETYGGILWEFLKFIKHARNVTFSIVTPPKKEFGFCYGTSNCTGMIGMVNRREVDFALGALHISFDQPIDGIKRNPDMD